MSLFDLTPDFAKPKKWEWEDLPDSVQASAMNAGITEKNVLLCIHYSFEFQIFFNPEAGVFKSAIMHDGSMGDATVKSVQGCDKFHIIKDFK